MKRKVMQWANYADSAGGIKSLPMVAADDGAGLAVVGSAGDLKLVSITAAWGCWVDDTGNLMSSEQKFRDEQAKEEKWRAEMRRIVTEKVSANPKISIRQVREQVEALGHKISYGFVHLLATEAREQKRRQAEEYFS